MRLTFYFFGLQCTCSTIVVVIIINVIMCSICCVMLLGTNGDMQWYLSQVKGTIEEDVTEGK